MRSILVAFLACTGSCISRYDAALPPEDAGTSEAGASDAGSDMVAAKAIRVVQKTGGEYAGAGATSYSAEFSTPNTAGNAIVVFAYRNGGTSSVVSDSLGNTYSSVVNVEANGGVGQIFYASNILGGRNTIVHVIPDTAPVGLVAFEYEGLAQSDMLDAHGSAAALSPGTSVTSPVVVTSTPRSLLFAGVFDVSSSGTIASGTGFTPLHVNTNFYLLVEEQVVSSQGSYSASATMPAPVTWGVTLAAFKGAR